MKLSFVVPVFDVKEYLEECFHSIFSQITGECEIILVDDGSRDGSAQMCDRYGALGDYVKVIHQENGGVAAARNAGLEASAGEYVAFVDADDKLAEGCVKKLLHWIDQGEGDICFLRAVKLYPDGRREDLGDGICREKVTGKTKDEVLGYLATRPKFSGAAWTKLCRKEFLDEHSLRFPPGVKIGEDLAFVRDCIMQAETYDALDGPYYQYRQDRSGSATCQVTVQRIEGQIRFLRETIERHSAHGEAVEPYGKYALSFAVYEYGVLLSLLGVMEDKDKAAEYMPVLEEFRWITRYSFSRREKIFRGMLRAWGTKSTVKLLGLVSRIKEGERNGRRSQ